VCYWRDMTFVPHLLNLLSKRRVQVKVRFHRPPPMSLNRKELAIRLREEILKLKSESETRSSRPAA